MKNFKRLTLTLLIFTLMFSSSNLTFASESTEELYIPEGFESVKILDSTKVQAPLKISTDLPTAKSFTNSTNVNEDVYNFKIIENETHPIQELRNIATGQIVTQYKANFAATALNQYIPKQTTDSAGTIHVYGTVYYLEYPNSDSRLPSYYGIDKLSYRYEVSDYKLRKIASKLDYFQQGAVMDNTKNGAFQEYQEPKYTEIKNGAIVTILVRNKNWSPVAANSSTSRIGMVLETTTSTFIAPHFLERFALAISLV